MDKVIFFKVLHIYIYHVQYVLFTSMASGFWQIKCILCIAWGWTVVLDGKILWDFRNGCTYWCERTWSTVYEGMFLCNTCWGSMSNLDIAVILSLKIIVLPGRTTTLWIPWEEFLNQCREVSKKGLSSMGWICLTAIWSFYMLLLKCAYILFYVL